MKTTNNNTKLTLTEVACILANESGLLHCSLEQAWYNMAPEFIKHYDFEAVCTELFRLEEEMSNAHYVD